jgi:hypothetical protein
MFLFSQQNWTIDLSRGLSIPTGQFNNAAAAEVGSASSVNAAYRFSKFAGMGLSLGYTSNDMDTDLLRNQLSALTGENINTTREGEYHAIHLLLGPRFGYFSNTFSIGLMPKIGYQYALGLRPAFIFPEDNIELDFEENYEGSIMLGAGLSANWRQAEVLEIGFRINYLYANHDSELRANALSDNGFFSLSSSSELNYRSLQLMLIIGASF